MTTQQKKDSVEIVNEVLPLMKKGMKERPNIDHLIKRILTERRQEERKNIYIFTMVLTVVVGIIIFMYYS